MDQYLVKRHHQDPGYGWFPEAVDGMGCESILAYSHGELFPIVHDDILRGVDLLQQQKTTCSFRIIGKLGCGSYSTVWLGRDLNSDRYLALKVLEREESTVHNSEMRILRKLGKLQVAFFHTHPQSGFRYLCLGLKPLGSSLSNRDDARIPYPSSLMEITSFMKVLIGKVIELHRKGICHGDISSGNVAFGVHENAFTPEALRKTFSSARKSYILFDGPENPPPALPPNLPKYIIKANIPVLLTDIEDLSKVDLLDFGQAFEGVSKENVHGTTPFVAPERQKEGTPEPSSAKSDIWSLGCVLVSGLTCNHLFNHGSTYEDYLEADDDQQLKIIASGLRSNEYLNQHPTQCWFVAHVIHSLVQVNPSFRDAKNALEIIDYLERNGNDLDRSRR